MADKWGDRLKTAGVLKASSLVRVFNEVNRRDFLPHPQLANADLDRPLNIGFGQTNSQPTTVAMMLEWLAVKGGHRVLDIGAGSGWTTALLSALTQEDGTVLGVERISKLVVFGNQNLAKYHFKNSTIIASKKGRLGAPEFGPFDRILVSAAGEESWVAELTDQLLEGGRLVMPIVARTDVQTKYLNQRFHFNQSIRIVDKKSSGEITTKEIMGFAFVPLVKDD